MENDLISSSALLKEFEHSVPVVREFDAGFNAGIGTAKVCVGQAPTIEAVPVVHGRWVQPEGAQSETRACSICDNQVTMDFDRATHKPLFKGCPYCFARMDGEESQQ